MALIYTFVGMGIVEAIWLYCEIKKGGKGR